MARVVPYVGGSLSGRPAVAVDLIGLVAVAAASWLTPSLTWTAGALKSCGLAIAALDGS